MSSIVQIILLAIMILALLVALHTIRRYIKTKKYKYIMGTAWFMTLALIISNIIF